MGFRQGAGAGRIWSGFCDGGDATSVNGSGRQISCRKIVKTPEVEIVMVPVQGNQRQGSNGLDLVCSGGKHC